MLFVPTPWESTGNQTETHVLSANFVQCFDGRKEAKTENTMEFEDILKQVGEYGRYQKRLVYFFLIPTTTIFSILCMNTFFMLSEPDHSCFVPQLVNVSFEHQQLLSSPRQQSQSLTTNTSLDGQQQGDEKSDKVLSTTRDKIRYDSCHYFDIDYESEVSRFTDFISRFNASSGFVPTSDTSKSTPTKSCNRWRFDDTNYDSNAVTTLNLVCDQRHLKSLIQTIHGVGEVLGNPFFGWFSDRFGRHNTFFLAMCSGLLSSSSPIVFRGLIIFAACRFLNSFTSASLFNLPYIALTELVGPEHRTKLVGIGATCWTVGMCILPGIAYLSRDWITLTTVPTLMVIPMFAYWK